MILVVCVMWTLNIVKCHAGNGLVNLHVQAPCYRHTYNYCITPILTSTYLRKLSARIYRGFHELPDLYYSNQSQIREN